MDAISSIGQMFTSGANTLGSSTMPMWQKLLGLGSAGAGGIGNILAGDKRNQVLNQQLTDQKNLMNLVNNPTLLANKTAALEQPLSAGLTSSVGNAVQGYLAERGLSQAPGIQAETMAQGLAPYKLQEQQMAMQQMMQMLGLPAQASARFLPYPQSTDLSKLFQSLFKPNTTLNAQNSPIAASMIHNVTGGSNGYNPGDPTGTYDFGGLTAPLGNNIPSDTAAPYNGDNSGSNFNWMDLISGGGGLTPQAAS